MSTAFELGAFEIADSIAGAVVLNLTARWTETDRMPTLLLDDGRRRHRYASLTSEVDDDGWIRARYWLPAERLEPADARFALELSDGTIAELPEPAKAPPKAARARRLPPPKRRRRRPRPSPRVGYSWSLRARMAERGLHFTTELAKPLAERGIALSPAQVHRLVTGTPERLNLVVLAALCDILGCTPNELIECAPVPADGD
jgi:DNA-binding Xre family transcriptional regulator